ncbi:MAG: hypothetical protein FWC64_07310 [Treponema sp.]|nr:hypothetical protein [Treponema sp.]
MKEAGVLPFLLVILLWSCGSVPQPVEPFAPAVDRGAVAVQPVQVTEETYLSTMAELQTFIEALNTIIRARDYDAWVGYLANSFYAEINSGEFLARRTEELFRRDQMVASNMGRNPRLVQRRELQNSRDFFYHVVVPARSNDRLDAITFVTETRVNAYTVDARGNRLVLYDLERIGGRWMIIN